MWELMVLWLACGLLTSLSVDSNLLYAYLPSQDRLLH